MNWLRRVCLFKIGVLLIVVESVHELLVVHGDRVLAVVDAEDLECALAHHVALAGEAFAFAFGKYAYLKSGLGSLGAG